MNKKYSNHNYIVKLYNCRYTLLNKLFVIYLRHIVVHYFIFKDLYILVFKR